MIATLVHVHVKPRFLQEFIEVTRLNHEKSTQEPGNLRFDILQDELDPTKFILYEAYLSPESALAHKETEHYKVWRDTVALWMDRPREGLRHKLLYPDNL